MANIFTQNRTPYKTSTLPKSYSASDPAATIPALKTTAAKTYVQNQIPKTTQTSVTPTTVATTDNTEKIKSVQSQIADLTAQADALKKAGLTDTSEISKNATGGYEQNATGSYNKALTGYTDAYKAYIESLNPTAEQTAATQAYNQFKTDEATTLQNISDQTIPMRFITGQQKSVESRAEIEANRLQNEITAAKEAATAKQNAGLANISLQEKLLGLQQSPAEQAKSALDTEKTTAEIAKTKAETENIDKKFEEDKKEFGLTYAQKEREIAIEQQKANATTAATTTETTAAETAKQQSATQTLSLVNNLLTEGTSGITGVGQNPLNIIGVSNAKQLNEYNQLQGLLKLGIRGLIKGQGSVSDYEGKILGQAASSLGRNLSNEQFESALKQIRGVIKTNNGQTTAVTVYNPNTGEKIDSELTGSEIYELASEGNTITYQ